MINIVVPMAGAGSRFRNEGFSLPKPFIDVAGKMMIERVLDGIAYPNAHYTLIIQKRFVDENRDQLEQLSDNYNVAYICVDKLTQGACCTALAAHEVLNNNFPVVFVDSDNIFNNHIFHKFVDDCIERELDGSLLTFNTQKDCFSFVEINNLGYAIKTREKEVISNHAICGAYMFSRGLDFVKYAIEMLIYGDKTKNEYYMSNVYNFAIKNNAIIGIFDISKKDWNCVGTPEQLKEFEKIFLL